MSLRDPYLSAYAPLHACFESVGLGDYYLSVVESYLKNDAQMSLIVSPKDGLNRPWDETQRKRFEIDINQRFSRGRQGRVMTTDGSIDVNPIQYPPADLSGLQISKWERLLVANCFDVPISLLQAEDTNRVVASEGTHQHQYYAIAPRCCTIANALTHQAARPVDDRLFFAFDDPVKRDIERQTKVYDMQVQNGTRTINEVRRGRARAGRVGRRAVVRADPGAADGGRRGPGAGRAGRAGRAGAESGAGPGRDAGEG